MNQEFIFQYILTLSTIVLIPLLLWMGKKRDMRKITYAVFVMLIVADIAAYFLLGELATYFYLAAITAISLLFVRKDKQIPEQQTTE